MATYLVNRIRKETVYTPRAHEHIAAVCTPGGIPHSRAEVVASIAARNTWWSQGTDGSMARIKPLERCNVVVGCPATPYLTTAPDHTAKNNLDNLPHC